MNIFSKTKKNNRGMTLIELVVVLAIFAVVSSIVIFNYGDFRSSVSLGNLAEDIALSIRGAQGYAIGVKGVGIQGLNTQFPGYGMHFGPTEMDRSENWQKAFILFADIPEDPNNLDTADKQYHSEQPLDEACNIERLSFQNKCLQLTTISGTDKITSICNGGADGDCPPDASVDIVFVRPNQDAYFCFKPDPGAQQCEPGVSSVSIKINSIDNTQKVISIWNTGQIRIQ